MNKANLSFATLSGGCFWCTEALFKRLRGVVSVTPGYSGGNPELAEGKTGHAEAIQIAFDPKIIPYEKLLDVFWHTHDPTTLNRQGNDVGTQYRSAIFYHDQDQKRIAEKGKLSSFVTEIVPFAKFYPAESYNKDYYDRNKNNSYCNFVIDPKIQKLLKDYGKDIKEEYRAKL